MGRATLIDEQANEEQETDSLESQDTGDTIQAAEEEQPQQQPEPAEELPEKYQGKSLEDLAKMHMEAEKLLGRHSQEVGELRKVVDDFITNQSKAQTAAQSDEDEEVDFFLEPEKAVEKYVNNHPKIKEAEKYAIAQKHQAAQQQLQSKHPDIDTIVQDEKFQEWVKASKIRTQLFIQADRNYDVDAADELFSNWKERQQVVKQTARVEQQSRKQSAKAAQTGSKGASQTGGRKKVYRRADIIKLMATDPERYQALSGEIFQAYAEGRVK